MAQTLLLADDSPTIAKILQMALQQEPYEIRSVLTAGEALEALRANPPFFFLVDLTLPEKNGYEFARLIRSDPKLAKTRVVLLASAFEPVDEAEYQRCGADGLVKKPFDPGELRATLRTIAEKPPQFPEGSQVTGSLSGLKVTQDPPTDPLANLLDPPAASGDADSILAGLLGNAPPGAPATPPADPAPEEPGVVNLDFGAFPETPITPVQEPDPETSPAAPEAAEAPLSPNAQALAAFFEAEINSQTSIPAPPPPSAAPSAPPASPPDAFDASLGSIEWSTPAEASLNEWSSGSLKAAPEAPPPAPTPRPAPAAAAPQRPPYTPPRPVAPAAPSASDENFLFDTGGSSFRFSEDYIRRITKSFTGAPFENEPQTATPPPAAPFFPQQSDDRRASPPPPPAAAPASGVGGGAWSEQDVKRIEQIVREEVQMVVREVAEKIAWEVIPELAENLIRKELDKVLKEMNQEG